jgi:hypothetical protein
VHSGTIIIFIGMDKRLLEIIMVAGAFQRECRITPRHHLYTVAILPEMTLDMQHRTLRI